MTQSKILAAGSAGVVIALIDHVPNLSAGDIAAILSALTTLTVAVTAIIRAATAKTREISAALEIAERLIDKDRARRRRRGHKREDDDDDADQDQDQDDESEGQGPGLRGQQDGQD